VTIPTENYVSLWFPVFTVRCHASAVYAGVVCLSVCDKSLFYWKRKQCHTKPVEICWSAQTTAPISAARGPKYTILLEHVEEILLLTSLFPIVDACHSCEDIAGHSCTMVRRWRLFGDFLRPAFPASRVQHVSDLRPKFALRPHHVPKYGKHPISDRWD